MRFPKETREEIYSSGGKPVEIAWPKGADEPRPGHKYTVQSSSKASEVRVLVLFTDETDEGWRAYVRLDTDPVRLLGKSSGYSTAAAGGMAVRKRPDPNPMGGPQFRSEYEPEAVSEAYLDELLEAQAEERRARITADIDRIKDAIESAEENPDLTGELRFHRSLLCKLEARKLELTPPEKPEETAA